MASSGDIKKAKKNKTAADSTLTPSDDIRLEKRIISAIQDHPTQHVAVAALCTQLQITLDQALPILNNLFSQHRVKLLYDSNQQFFCKWVQDDIQLKLRELNGSELIIYQLIEKEANMGIWIRDLKRKSNLSQQQIPKILKSLMTRKLVKCEKSVESKNRKVYMLYNLEPAKEITGGSWYSGSEFDIEFMKALEQAITKFMQKKHVDNKLVCVSAEQVAQFIQSTGIFTVTCSVEEIEKILNSLSFDGIIERIVDSSSDLDSSYLDSPSSLTTFNQTKKRKREQTYVYRFVPNGQLNSSINSIPCAMCPVAHACSPGNPISPQTCQYFQKWLDF